MKVLIVFHVIDIVIIAVHRLLCLFITICGEQSSVRTAATDTQDGGLAGAGQLR